jgi:hypothetical protein
MPQFRVTSRCECQAKLEATLDEHHQVLEGRATRGSSSHKAPAHLIGGGERFDLGWLCPYCGRNTLRSFHVGALRRVTEPATATTSS